MNIQDFHTGDRVKILVGPQSGKEGWVVLPPEIMSGVLLKQTPWPGIWCWIPVFFSTHFESLDSLLQYIRAFYPLVSEDGKMQDARNHPRSYIFSPYYLVPEEIQLINRRKGRGTRRRGKKHAMRIPEVGYGA